MITQESLWQTLKTERLRWAYTSFEKRRAIVEASSLLDKPEYQKNLLPAAREILINLQSFVDGSTKPYGTVGAIILGNWVFTMQEIEYFHDFQEIKRRYARHHILQLTREKVERE